MKPRIEFRVCGASASDTLGLIDWMRGHAWTDWQPCLRVVIATEHDASSRKLYGAWPGHLLVERLPDAQISAGTVFALPVSYETTAAVVCIDASLRLPGSVESLLGRVVDESLVAGVITDRILPLRPGETCRQAWEAVTSGLCATPELTHTYPATDWSLPLALRTTPFAPNPALILLPARGLARIAGRYAFLLPRLPERLDDHRIRHQVALCLAIAQSGIGTWALSSTYLLASETRVLGTTPRGQGRLHPSATAGSRLAVDGHAQHAVPALVALEESLAKRTALQNGEAAAEVDTGHVILGSGLFDADYYLTEYPDVAESGTDPLQHYVELGEDQGRRPNAFFNPDFYRSRHLGGDRSVCALGHYIEVGESQGLSTQLFDPARYLRYNPALQSFADRPMLHYLRIGRHSHVAGVPTPDAARHLAHFERTKNVSPGALMRYKQALVRQFGIDEGFAVLGETLDLPDSQRIRSKRVTGQHAYARASGETLVETHPGGERVVIDAVEVVGDGRTHPASVISRASYVACIGAGVVRGHSSYIDVGADVLFDFERDELERVDSEFEFDHAIFHATSPGSAWVFEPADSMRIPVIDSAFSLLSARSHAFGHWMWETLPKFVAASLSGLPPMPILIDADMSASHRQSLEWMLRPGDRIVEVPNFTNLRVRNLWCAPTLHFSTVFERRHAGLQWDDLMHSPARSAPVLAHMGRCADLQLGPADRSSPERIYLARRVHRHAHHILRNHAQIEALARHRGFQICYPEQLSFSEQVRLVRNARFILGPTGSALFLGMFARPGAHVCLLDDARTIGFELFQSLFAGIPLQTTLFTGPVVAEHDLYYEWADYEIDATALEVFLDRWLARDAR